ncbi:MAG: hypothetical protein IPI65_01225 [Bacteroidetes bacterium]|nr:hypothetical protein [Bacteroidota bacterium]
MKSIQMLFTVCTTLCVFASCQKNDLTPVETTQTGAFNLAKLAPADFIDESNFVDGVTNPYFPLNIGDTLWYQLYIIEDGDSVFEDSYVTVTTDTKIIEGINCTVIRDYVTVDGIVAEDTYDWYAQDIYGNVWYLGEDTKKYFEDGTFSTDGSFEHGVDGAVGGLFMLADPDAHIGHQYQQENYAGFAEDRAKIVGVNETITIGLGTFTNCVKTAETSPLAPGILGYKYYAPGIGQVYSFTAIGEIEAQELVETNF